MRNAFRDFFRRRRIRRHEQVNGPRYSYHGLEVEVPARVGVGVCNALLRGKYEPDEAAMILKHLPGDLPVIELGGSLGVVSRLVRSRLAAGTRHLVVEANSDLIDICTANAKRDAAPGATEVINAAVYYDGPVARFGIGRDVHTSALDDGSGRSGLVEVPAITFSQLCDRLGVPSQLSLVSDIEGGEYDLFFRETDLLDRIDTAIVELHPQSYTVSGGSLEALLQRCEAAGLRLVDRQADVYIFKR